MEETSYVDGVLEAIYFENAQNFYKVMRVRVIDSNIDLPDDEIVIVGSFGQVAIGEDYHFTGRLIEHPRYGLQFTSESYAQLRPTSASGIVSYLSSDKFKGIGKKTAEKIVDHLGENAIDLILEDPSTLDLISGLSKKMCTNLLETLRLNYGMEKVIIGLNEFGFGSQLAFAIYQKYQNRALEVIQTNPYQLVEDIDGIGFTKADLLAEQLGIGADSSARIGAAILHRIFEASMESGDTYIEADDLLQQVAAMLERARPVEIPFEKIADEIVRLSDEEKIQQDELRLFENSLYYAEWGISTSIERLLKRKKKIRHKKEKVEKALDKLEKRNNISYGDSQRKAIIEAIASPFFILTGGPGTGKTTVIKGIVEVYAELNDFSLDIDDYTNKIFPIALAAPTGRASKRMNETTGLPAGTIHRLLGLTGREKEPIEEAKELEGGLLIVDEFSMVDTWLANLLLKSIPNDMQVIFVGDKDQLPSVSPGQVLHDLLQVKEIPKVELTDIYRQGNGSSIITLAHEIKNGHLSENFTQNQKDRSFFIAHTLQIESYIRQIVTKAKTKGFTAQDIQVLAPMYKGVAGINALNKMMQEIFNSNDTGKRKEVVWNDTVYRIGDKVLHLVNEPELNVFNGDFGLISGITFARDSEDKTDELTIDFDGNVVTYPRKDWQKITLSYATSIHKSQGSEFKMVILPFVMQYRRMLQRNLLYTAITRSRELLILLGEVEAYKLAVANESATRKTMLKERLTSGGSLSIAEEDEVVAYHFYEKENEDATPTTDTSFILTEELIKEGTIPPMIGMDELTPYDFM